MSSVSSILACTYVLSQILTSFFHLQVKFVPFLKSRLPREIAICLGKLQTALRILCTYFSLYSNLVIFHAITFTGVLAMFSLSGEGPRPSEVFIVSL